MTPRARVGTVGVFELENRVEGPVRAGTHSKGKWSDVTRYCRRQTNVGGQVDEAETGFAVDTLEVHEREVHELEVDALERARRQSAGGPRGP
jgi:hypothetical protein